MKSTKSQVKVARFITCKQVFIHSHLHIDSFVEKAGVTFIKVNQS